MSQCQLRLMVFPAVLGDCERLFGDNNDKKQMRLGQPDRWERAHLSHLRARPRQPTSVATLCLLPTEDWPRARRDPIAGAIILQTQDGNERGMKRSTDRIRTTHIGSLPRPPDVLEYVTDVEWNEPVDRSAFDQAVRRAVADVVKQRLRSHAACARLRRGDSDRPGDIRYLD